MMIIRPIERRDLADLLTLAGKSGIGLTSLPQNEDTLSARIERALKTWQGELPQSDQCYLFVLEDSERRQAVGVCAIEVAVGWRNLVQLPRRHAGARFQTAERL